APGRTVPVTIRVDRARYAEVYGAPGQLADSYRGMIRRTQAVVLLRFDAGATYPQTLATIAKVSKSRDDELQGRLVDSTGVVFQPVYFVKLNAIAAAALDFAKTAAEIALGLIGVLALFLGMLKIAEQAGVIYALVKLVRPVLRPIFPELPPDHPALGMIALNMAANVFGL